MNQRGPQVNHLAYVDGIVIFSSGHNKSVRLVMQQITRYEKASGQKLNKCKSFFLTDPKARAHKINRMREVTGFMEKNFPFNYLGCSLYVGRKKLSHFDNMVTKITKRLNGWQGRMLTCRGRMVLIKSVLLSLPI